MASDLVPHNISFTDESAFIRLNPHRDGPIDTEWNVSFSDSLQADWSYSNNFGFGNSVHTTTCVGCYVLLDWAGTAVWLYGQADQGTYTVQLDQGGEVQGQGSTSNGVLFSQTGLTYGPHTVYLWVIKGEVSITGATITVGMGESGTVLQTRNISAVLNDTFPTTGNPFFTADESWSAVNLYANQSDANPYPCIATYTEGATLSFELNETVGFAIYGSDDWFQGIFTVAVTSVNASPESVSTLPNSTIQYSPRSGWTTVNQLKFLATGLDRTVTYHVDVQNWGNTFNLGSVLVYDAVPSSSSSVSATLSGTNAGMGPSSSVPATLLGTNAGTGPSSTSGSGSTPTSVPSSLAKGAIVGIAVGSAIGTVILVAVLFCYLARRKRNVHELIDVVSATYAKDYMPVTPVARPPEFTPAMPSVVAPEAFIPPSVSEQCEEASLPVLDISRSNADAYDTFGSQIHERDAGPMMLPPVYDPAWAESE